MEVVLSFDGGEDVGEFDRRDILPDEIMEVRVDFRSVAIDPETVDKYLATAVVINNALQISVFDEESVASLCPKRLLSFGIEK